MANFTKHLQEKAARDLYIKYFNSVMSNKTASSLMPIKNNFYYQILAHIKNGKKLKAALLFKKMRTELIIKARSSASLL